MSSTASHPKQTFALLYFASAKSYTKKEQDQIPAPLPLSKLFETLEGMYTGIKSSVLDSCLVTVNLEYVDVEGDEDGQKKEDFVIQAGDEVAIIPPVSSG